MDSEELVEKLMKGEIKLREVEDHTKDSNRATEIRRKYLEKKYGLELKHIGKSSIDFNDALNRNIENPIGATQVPLGLAGELKVNGEYVKGSFPILLATTEGRLVAGVSRGIKVFNKAGGVNTVVLKDGMTRDMLLRTPSAKHAAKLIRWIKKEEIFDFLSEEFSKKTRHGKLKEVKAYTIGRDVHLRFRAFTGAAMGMNMVTIASSFATRSLIERIKKELGFDVQFLSETGNLCTDKKPAYINILEGRGVSVVADAFLPKDIVIEDFKVEPEKIAELNRVKCYQGSALAGSHGFNAHIANVLAAMYIAYGQDAAQIVEGSQAFTDVSLTEDGLYVSCFLPCLEVGTYGGGTKRETQQEALKLLGLYGEGDEEGKTRLAFAEIVAAVCLVADVNLLAAEAALHLSKSHESIKRG